MSSFQENKRNDRFNTLTIENSFINEYGNKIELKIISYGLSAIQIYLKSLRTIVDNEFTRQEAVEIYNQLGFILKNSKEGLRDK